MALMRVREKEFAANTDPKITNYADFTALHYAVLANAVPVAEALIRSGADVNALTKAGHTPMSLAKERNFAEMLSLFEKPIVKEEIIDGQSSSLLTRSIKRTNSPLEDEGDSTEVKDEWKGKMGEFHEGEREKGLSLVKEGERKGQTTSGIPEENFDDWKKDETGGEESRDKGNTGDKISGDEEKTGRDAARDKLASIVMKEPTLSSPPVARDDRIQTAGSREESMDEKERKGEDVGSKRGEEKRNKPKIDLKEILESQLVGQRFAVEQVSGALRRW